VIADEHHQQPLRTAHVRQGVTLAIRCGQVETGAFQPKLQTGGCALISQVSGPAESPGETLEAFL
jgi:hypothetical protein